MKNTLNWEIYSYDNRHTTIDLIQELIDNNHAYIMDSQIYSDLALVLNTEVTEANLMALHNQIDETMYISELNTEKFKNDPEHEWMVLMNISFKKGKGDLTNEIPNVPG